MRKYTKDEFLMAAKLGEVSMIDAEYIVKILDEIHPKEEIFQMSSLSHLKEYVYDRQIAIDKELDRKSNSRTENPFINAYYNRVKIELKAIEMLIDALIEKQKILDKIGVMSDL